MLNSLYALILTDSLHLPTAIGFFNTRQAASYARRTARLYLAHESQPLDDLRNFSNAVNSPLPNENFTDLNALADALRKALDEGTQIIL